MTTPIIEIWDDHNGDGSKFYDTKFITSEDGSIVKEVTEQVCCGFLDFEGSRWSRTIQATTGEDMEESYSWVFPKRLRDEDGTIPQEFQDGRTDKTAEECATFLAEQLAKRTNFVGEVL